MIGYAKDLAECGKQNQIINPWQFGHLESKQTCLWLKGLHKLKENTKCIFRNDASSNK